MKRGLSCCRVYMASQCRRACCATSQTLPGPPRRPWRRVMGHELRAPLGPSPKGGALVSCPSALIKRLVAGTGVRALCCPPLPAAQAVAERVVQAWGTQSF